MKTICLKLFDYNDQSMIETTERQFWKEKIIYIWSSSGFLCVSTLNNTAKVLTIALLPLLWKLLKLNKVSKTAYI